MNWILVIWIGMGEIAWVRPSHSRFGIIYNLKIMSYDLKVINYNLKAITYSFKMITSYNLKVITYHLQS